MLQSSIKKMPYFLQKHIIRLLYFKSGRFLQDFKSVNNGKFFYYKLKDVYVPSESLGWYVDYEYYESWVSKISAFAYNPKEGDVVVDIGAGIGEETIVFSKMTGLSGKVYSVEANPEVFKVLTEIVELNQLDNVELINAAIAAKDGSVLMTIDEESFLGGNIGVVSSDKQTFEVPGFRFDSFVEKNSIQRIDLLKTNIEGAERFVIETLGNSLKIIKNVAISCHDFRTDSAINPFFKTKSLVKEFLLDNGFEIFSQNTKVCHIDDWIYGKNLNKE